MSRPGFIIPNANLVAPDYQAAQPDQGDFVVLGNGQYGVISGCKPVLNFPTVSLTTDDPSSTANILVCAGRAFLLTGGSTVNMAQAGAQGRWDLIVFDSAAGGFKAVGGVPANNPSFPDITNTMTLLAAVSVPASSSGATPTLIDKRKFLSTTLVADASTPSMVRSYDTSVPTPSIRVNIDGQGRITWNPLTALENTAPGVLRVTNELQAAILRAGQLFVGGIEVTSASHITWGTTRPGSGDRVGDIYVNTDTGDISVWMHTTWVSLETSIPPGSVIMSFLAASQMPGWLPLLGQTVSVNDAGSLPTLFPTWVTGTSLRLPDMRGRLPVGGGFIDSGSPGFVDGTTHGDRVNDQGMVSVTIGIDELPSHVHQTGTLTDPAGNHAHRIPIWAAFQPLGGVVSNVGSANTNGVVIDSLTSTRFDGQHAHQLPTHRSVGGDQPLQVTPPTMSLFFYIKI